MNTVDGYGDSAHTGVQVDCSGVIVLVIGVRVGASVVKVFTPFHFPQHVSQHLVSSSLSS